MRLTENPDSRGGIRDRRTRTRRERISINLFVASGEAILHRLPVDGVNHSEQATGVRCFRRYLQGIYSQTPLSP
jgi:hypothetical protein